MKNKKPLHERNIEKASSKKTPDTERTMSERHEAFTSVELEGRDTIEDPIIRTPKKRETKKLHALKKDLKVSTHQHYTPFERTSKLWPNPPTEMRKREAPTPSRRTPI
jgi:hypothetical protein